MPNTRVGRLCWELGSLRLSNQSVSNKRYSIGKSYAFAWLSFKKSIALALEACKVQSNYILYWSLWGVLHAGQKNVLWKSTSYAILTSCTSSCIPHCKMKRPIYFRFWGWLHSIQFRLYRVNWSSDPRLAFSVKISWVNIPRLLHLLPMRKLICSPMHVTSYYVLDMFPDLPISLNVV